MELQKILDGWSDEQLINVSTLLGMDASEPSNERVCERIKWLYYSRARESLKSGAAGSIRFFSRKILKSNAPVTVTTELVMPTYEELVYGLSRQLGVFVQGSSLVETEKYVSHAIIIRALTKMKPAERSKFFEAQIDVSGILGGGSGLAAHLRGPLTSLAALGAANAAGFSLYLASTTALGFVTHAVGVTLPFAIYTGMTSTIAFLIGPVGWLAAGSWLAWRVTGPDWGKLTPAIIYLINTRAAESIEIPVSVRALGSELGLELSAKNEPVIEPNSPPAPQVFEQMPSLESAPIGIENAHSARWKNIQERVYQTLSFTKSFLFGAFLIFLSVIGFILITGVVGLLLPQGNPVSRTSCYVNSVAYYTIFGELPTLPEGQTAIGHIKAKCA